MKMENSIIEAYKGALSLYIGNLILKAIDESYSSMFKDPKDWYENKIEILEQLKGQEEYG